MQMADWISILIAHLIRCPSTIETAVDRVTPEDIQQVHGFTTSLLWTFSRDYFRQYKRVIPRTSLEAELVQYNTGTWLLEISSADVCDFIDWAYSIPTDDFNHEEAIGHIRRLLEQTRVQNKIQAAAIEGNVKMEELASTINNGMEEARIGCVEVINPLLNATTMMGGTPPDPIGGAEVNYFNMLCQGGLRRGEIAVLLGPSGGFKTTMALDICCAMANSQEYSMYLTYEQAFHDGDLPIRILARMGDIDKNRVETVTFNQLNTDEQKRVTDAQNRSHYIQLLDRSTSIDRVGDISDFVKQQERKGCKPRLLVIDQLLPWLDKWDDVTPDNVRLIGREVINTLKQEVASKHGIAVIVLHQLSAALAGGSATRVPHHTDSQECKSICNWADFGIAMGNLNHDAEVMWIAASKTRRGVETKLLIKPEGGKCHLRLCDDYELSTDGKFVQKGGAANRITPATSGPKRGSNQPLLTKGDL